MRTQLAIYTLDNVLLADWSTRIKSCHVRTNTHGYESCEAELQLPFLEAFLYYQQLGPLKLRVSWGSYRIWEGRLEDPTQFANVSSGLKITAFGGWVAYNDAPYTALWSDSKLDQWRIANVNDVADAVPDRFQFDTNTRLYMAPEKNATVGNAPIIAARLIYDIPDGSSRNITGISFDLDLFGGAGWTVGLQNAAFTVLWSLNATGVAQTNAINITFTGTSRLYFYMYYNAAPALYAGETGVTHLELNNVRVVTSTANRISTTLGTNIAAGAQTVTPASMARIFVGQRLFIDQGGATVGESVIVTAITATTFTAVFALAHVIASTVTAHLIYPDEIIDDCVTALNTLNPTQVSSDTALIQSQAIDLDQSIYEDQYPSEIINQLVAKSDNQTTPRQWVALVYDDVRLIVRPRGSGLAWYTDITSLDVVRTLTQLYNSVYAVYSDVANKRQLRTAISTNAASVTQFQITRRKPIKVDSTNAVQANQVAASVLALQVNPIPRASVDLDRVFDKYGSPFPLFFIRADDTLTLRNLPPTLTAVLYDKIRTLVITRTDVDLMKNSIKLELEIPMPDLNVQMAQALKGKIK